MAAAAAAARLQRADGIRRRPRARPADGGMAGRTVSRASRRATSAGGWRMLVSQPVLAEVAEAIGLGEALSVAPGEAKAGVRRRATVLADALEAALGALYLDGGLERARAIRAARVGRRDDAGRRRRRRTPRPRCRNGRRRAGWLCRTMRLPSRVGPPHAPEFVVTVTVGGRHRLRHRRQQARGRTAGGEGSAAGAGRVTIGQAGSRHAVRLCRRRRARRTPASPRWSTGWPARSCRSSRRRRRRRGSACWAS